MAITEKDIKKLWGLAAGRCSRPGCDESCIKFLSSDPTIIGEMAHVVAHSPIGPRASATGGADTYDNLILLCPTHHTEIDKAPPGTFTVETLLDWKKRHEAEISDAFKSPIFSSRFELATYIRKLLIENRAAWATYGPESSAAKQNPLSNLHIVWALRKLDTIVPNNRRIVNAIKRNSKLIEVAGYAAACSFIEHAEGFEQSCYDRKEGVPRFPSEFDKVIDDYTRQE